MVNNIKICGISQNGMFGFFFPQGFSKYAVLADVNVLIEINNNNCFYRSKKEKRLLLEHSPNVDMRISTNV